MPEVKIMIGGREFEVACKSGEEKFLQSAAKLLDIEASALAEALGRLPESRMLLMSGLMLADKTANLEDNLRRQTTGEPESGNTGVLGVITQRAEKAETRLQSTRDELVSVKQQLELSQIALTENKVKVTTLGQTAAETSSDATVAQLAEANAEIKLLQEMQTLALEAMNRMVAKAEAAAGMVATAKE